MSRNITVKAPHSVLDWKPFYQEKAKTEGSAQLITQANRIIANQSMELKIFHIRNYIYKYDIEIMTIKPYMGHETSTGKDEYFLVVDGKLDITGNFLTKRASRDDIIVVDKNTNYKLRTQTGCVLYSVKCREDLK